MQITIRNIARTACLSQLIEVDFLSSPERIIKTIEQKEQRSNMQASRQWKTILHRMNRQCLSIIALMGIFLSQMTEMSSAEDRSHLVEVTNRRELLSAVSQAKPGTKILIAAGEYRGGLTFTDLIGTKEKPIVLQAADPDHPPIFVGGGSGIHLRRPAHVALRNLVFTGATGNGLNIDDGGDPQNPAREILLDRLQVRNVGPKGNRDGIKLSGVDRFVIERCLVERWGESGSAIDMVGCHDGEIRHCEFKYRNDISGNGVQTKGGSADITIRRCRFENAGSRALNLGGSTGRDYFRPRDANYEAKNITVEDCTLIGSMSPVAFVGVDGATVRHNTIYRPQRWVIRILQESRGSDFIPCRNGIFAKNIIVFRSDEVRTVVNVGGQTSPETFRFANNHWYCLDQPRLSQRLGLPTPETEGTYGENPRFRDPERGEFRLRDSSPVKDSGVRFPEKSAP